MHHNIAAYQAAVRRHVTVLIPWTGENEDLLREALRTLPKGVRVMIAKNAGKHEMASALNAALDMVSTKYVFLMGSDDIVDRNTLWRLWEAAIDHDGAYPTMIGFGAQRFRAPADSWSLPRIQDANVCGIFLIKTSVLQAVGGWRDTPIEDWDLVYRIAKAGYRLTPAPLARYGYRQRENGLHRTTVREAQKLEMTWQDLAPYDVRTPMPAVFYQWRLDGTGYVRCELPARATTSACRMTWDTRDAHEAPSWVFQYPHKQAIELWDMAEKRGKRRVIDVDDNYLSPDLAKVVGRYSPKNAAIWADVQESHRAMTAEADYVICATPALAEVYRTVNPRVVVCENSVDLADWPKSPTKKRIVGCALSMNHKDDAHLVEDALREASLVKGVEVQIVGMDPSWDFAYTHIGFTPTVAMYRRVVSRWSIGLAPVVDNDVTRCKSDLKWLEFTASGAAGVLSASEAYSRVPFGCSMTATTADDFTEATMLLLQDESERKRLVKESAFHVKRNRLVDNEELLSRYTVALG